MTTLPFSKAYASFYHELEQCIKPGMNVLEVGGGAHPSLEKRGDLSYTILDPDLNELSKAPGDVHKINSNIESFEGDEKYDLVVTKMVLEHLSDPDAFHKSILRLMKPEGRAIHFFACRHSIPGFANRILPEKFGEKVLQIIGNRRIEEFPKYPAFYKRTKGGVSSQITYFENLGFTIELYASFVGHKYFRKVPILNMLEQLYTQLLTVLKLKALATVAIVALRPSSVE